MEAKQGGAIADTKYSVMISIGVVLTIVGFVLGYMANGMVNSIMVLGMLLIIVGYLRRITRALERKD
ncbi:hypothetical protein [Citricoccus sp. GCM10030269]|uniref:hypothetical protein n=1 Tax=Citricoccus sp. GCM10030269 TaxID=3273388 RepID=UPI003605E72D